MSACKAKLEVIKWCILLSFFQSGDAITCGGILLPGVKKCPQTMSTTTPQHTISTPDQSNSTTTPRLTGPSAGAPVNGNSSEATTSHHLTSAPGSSPRGVAERFVGDLNQKDNESVLIKVLSPVLGLVVPVIVFTVVVICVKKYFKQRPIGNEEEEHMQV